MNPQRIALKLFTTAPVALSELHPFIGLFHRFIQQAALPGLLIDVADYAHVPEGPGVILIGHEVDYGIDLAGARSGLLTTRKRPEGADLAALFRDVLTKSLAAARAIEADDATSLRFATDAAQLLLPDRLVTPNRPESFEAVAKELEPLVRGIFGDAARIENEAEADPRRMLTLRLAGDGADLTTLAQRAEAL